MALTTREYQQLALKIVATDRALARGLLAAIAKHRPIRATNVLLAAAIRDALIDTTVSTLEQQAHRLLQQTRQDKRRKG